MQYATEDNGGDEFNKSRSVFENMNNSAGNTGRY